MISSHYVSAFLASTLLILPAKTLAQESSLPPHFDFQGRFLVVASDTDMLPSAYIDGKLGPSAGQDAVSVIPLGNRLGKQAVASVPVSNSVIGPPASLALSPDGRLAIVVETKGQARPGSKAKMLNELPVGRRITVLNLENAEKPKVVQVIDGYENPLTVSINAQGTLAAVTIKKGAGEQKSTLVFYRIHDGQLSEPILTSIPGKDAGDAVISAEFHPKSDILGIVYSEHPRLTLVRVEDQPTCITLKSWGDPVPLDIGSFLVKFTADGRFALVNAMLLGTERRGTVSSIQLEQSHSSDGAPHHVLISRVDTGFQPEGIAVSPDERWVATTNLEHSFFAIDDPRQGFFASVTLLHFDIQTGVLDRVGEFPFDGRLPEAVTFDNSSKFIAVGCFAHFDPARPDGSIDFWRIAGDYTDARRTELVKMDYSIRVPRGPQSLAIAR